MIGPLRRGLLARLAAGSAVRRLGMIAERRSLETDLGEKTALSQTWDSRDVIG